MDSRLDIEKNNNKELVPLEHYLKSMRRRIRQRSAAEPVCRMMQKSISLPCIFLDAAMRWDIRNLPYSRLDEAYAFDALCNDESGKDSGRAFSS